VVARAWGKGEMGTTNAYRVSIWNDEKVLELNSNSGCTTLSTKWCIFIKKVNFMECELYHRKKEVALAHINCS
jgi:hypothetical protein